VAVCFFFLAGRSRSLDDPKRKSFSLLTASLLLLLAVEEASAGRFLEGLSCLMAADDDAEVDVMAFADDEEDVLGRFPRGKAV